MSRQLIFDLICPVGLSAIALRHRVISGFGLGLVCMALSVDASSGAKPISLHPDNPHYFLFRGKPTVLITSGEHYGAVLNRDFDYREYLDTLGRNGLNLTRTFSGAYVEPSGAFKIVRNTLAPEEERFICPWARSETPRYRNGGNKFDLTRWDTDYFDRLKDFMAHAAKRGIVVEYTFFCPFYGESQWALSPQNAANNVNGIGTVARTNVYTLDRHGGLLAVQEALVRKVVTELREFDNVMYEICNEPYFGGVTLAWQHHIADVIVDAETGFPHKHLITQNIANGKAKIEQPHPAVSVFNFHYAQPPDTVTMNYQLNRVIGDNETGFRGTNDLPYRVEAWQFILAGGGLFNNLDYSFVVGHEDGTFVYPDTQPGGGNPDLRQQLKNLREFMRSLDFVQMHPTDAGLEILILDASLSARMLAGPDTSRAVYIGPKNPREALKHPPRSRSATIAFELPVGTYRSDWVNTQTGKTTHRETHRHKGGKLVLTSPAFVDDIALRLRKR